jgi:YbbR domain-containing protein
VPQWLRLFTENWQLKLLAFALAVLLWVVVSGEQVQSHAFPVALDVRVSDPRFQLIRSSVPSEVDVAFVGPGREFVDLALRRPTLVLDVGDIDTTEAVFTLSPAMVQVPAQLNLAPRAVDPSRIRVRFRRLDSRVVPVRVPFGAGYGSEWTVVDSLRIEPTSVEIRGAETRISGISAVSTLPLRLAPQDSDFSRWIAIDTSKLDGIRLSTRRIRVSGEADRVVDRMVPGVPVSVGEGVSVTPAAVDVHVRGARSVVRSLTPSDLRVVVAIDSVPANVPPQGIMVPLRVENGAGVAATAVPAIVRLEVGRLPVDTLPLPAGPGR